MRYGTTLPPHTLHPSISSRSRVTSHIPISTHRTASSPLPPTPAILTSPAPDLPHTQPLPFPPLSHRTFPSSHLITLIPAPYPCPPTPPVPTAETRRVITTHPARPHARRPNGRWDTRTGCAYIRCTVGTTVACESLGKACEGLCVDKHLRGRQGGTEVRRRKARLRGEGEVVVVL